MRGAQALFEATSGEQWRNYILSAALAETYILFRCSFALLTRDQGLVIGRQVGPVKFKLGPHELSPCGLRSCASLR